MEAKSLMSQTRDFTVWREGLFMIPSAILIQALALWPFGNPCHICPWPMARKCTWVNSDHSSQYGWSGVQGSVIFPIS